MTVEEMKIGKAVAIFEQIDSDKYADEEKAIAIYKVINMPTHNGITKATVLKALKWLFDNFYEITEVEE